MFLIAILAAVVASFLGRRKAQAIGRASGGGGDPRSRMPALPGHYGAFLALCTGGPAFVMACIWPTISDTFVMRAVLASPVAKTLPAAEIDREAIIGEARGLADGTIEAAFNPASYELVKPITAAIQHFNLIGFILTLVLVLAGFAAGYLCIRRDFRARDRVETIVMVCLMAASLVALVTTFGIVASLLFETSLFFRQVPVTEFLFGTHWSPTTDIVPGQTNGFGAVPLFWGTVFIGAIIAMIIAIPIGVLTAIYLTQYARPTVRKWLKPTLEVLAGIPTVVYGYFAALTLGPAVREFALMLGMENPTSESALSAGLVMGVMIIPLISSMSDDSIAAVPASMRDGALALGATKSETVRKVLVPAALPGIVGGILLAVSRAIGETMIVVMAAGMAANLSANPFASVTTVTTQIVQLLTGDQEFDSAKTLSAFALGLVLFIVTLILNVIALSIVKRYREAYE
ncbi:phosphate ABC transporter permease subunit PstC [Sphingobium subterraneum]|nr:phosphate ABC transporter permease subunit PstC [Sphingobium subterraneum]